MSNKKKKKVDLAFMGCMFIGMGCGYLIGKFLVGMFIGMGIGFLAQMLFASDQ